NGVVTRLGIEQVTIESKVVVGSDAAARSNAGRAGVRNPSRRNGGGSIPCGKEREVIRTPADAAVAVEVRAQVRSAPCSQEREVVGASSRDAVAIEVGRIVIERLAIGVIVDRLLDHAVGAD